MWLRWRLDEWSISINLKKADRASGGEGWSDSKIIKAFNTSVSMVDLVRQQLGEEVLEAVLSRKLRAAVTWLFLM
jgi:hypothetical protein